MFGQYNVSDEVVFDFTAAEGTIFKGVNIVLECSGLSLRLLLDISDVRLWCKDSYSARLQSMSSVERLTQVVVRYVRRLVKSGSALRKVNLREVNIVPKAQAHASLSVRKSSARVASVYLNSDQNLNELESLLDNLHQDFMHKCSKLFNHKMPHPVVLAKTQIDLAQLKQLKENSIILFDELTLSPRLAKFSVHGVEASGVIG